MALSNAELRAKLKDALKSIDDAQRETRDREQIKALRNAIERAIELLDAPPPPPVGTPVDSGD